MTETPKRKARLPKVLRRWLRAAHRDIGYLSVGLTVVYALSGIAVNHIQDWEPNETTVQGVLEVELHDEISDLNRATAIAQALLGTDAQVDESSLYRVDAVLEFESGATRFSLDEQTAQTRWERDEDRFFIKAANWLHLNRGKKAWTYVADTYAVGLLFLALSGLWMIPGRKGLWGRGLVLVLLGASVPIAYVHFAKDGTHLPD